MPFRDPLSRGCETVGKKKAQKGARTMWSLQHWVNSRLVALPGGHFQGGSAIHVGRKRLVRRRAGLGQLQKQTYRER